MLQLQCVAPRPVRTAEVVSRRAVAGSGARVPPGSRGRCARTVSTRFINTFIKLPLQLTEVVYLFGCIALSCTILEKYIFIQTFYIVFVIFFIK